MNRTAWVSAAVVLLVGGIALASERTWTSSDGRTMRAEFVRELDGEVTLLKDGKIVSLPLDRLSERDQQVVRDLAAGKAVPEEPLTVPTEASSPPAATNPLEPAAAEGTAPPREASSAKPSVKKPMPSENRSWTDIHGNQMTGKFVRIFGSNVVLLRGGRSHTMNYHELSSEDQDYLRELLASRGQEALIPRPIERADQGQGNDIAHGSGVESPDVGNAPLASPDLGAGPRGPRGPQFPRGPGAGIPRGPGPAFPEAAAAPSMPGPGFPGSRGAPGAPSIPTPGMDGFGTSASPPGFGGGGTPGFGPPSTLPADVSPPGASFPSSAPPGFGTTPGGPRESPFDRLNEQLERSRQQQLDSIQQMQDRMSQQHEQLFNRHGSTGECLNCKHTLNEAEMRRTSCPYCGVTWDYEIDEFGNQRELNNSSLPNPFVGGGNAGGADPIDQRTARTIGLVVGVLIGLAVIIGMVIGVIYIAVSIASSGSRNQQPQQQYYRY